MLNTDKTSSIQHRMQQIPYHEFDTHVVQFYESDDFLIECIKKFIAPADEAIIIASKSHISKLQKKYGKNKINYFDANILLGKFMVNGLPDREKFLNTVGSLIANICDKGGKIHIFAEMVTILTREGNHLAAFELKKLWKEVQSAFSFSLLCAYPIDLFGDEKLTKSFLDICNTFTQVLPAESLSLENATKDDLVKIAILQQKAKALEIESAKNRIYEQQKDAFIAKSFKKIKSPLAEICLLSKTLENAVNKSSTNDVLAQIKKLQEQTKKLVEEVSDVFDIANISNKRLQYTFAEFDFTKLMQEVVDDIKSAFNRNVSVGQLKSKIMVGDKAKLGQAIANVISNAIQFSPKNKKVIIKSAFRKNQISISVQDFGGGIEKEEQKKLFNKYLRMLCEANLPSPNVGQGLAYASEVIRSHGGSIEVKSNPGKGSTFILHIPTTQ